MSESSQSLFLLLCITGHLVGDFTLQPGKIALKKRGLNRYMLMHVAIVSITTTFPILFISTPLSFLPVFAITAMGHLLVDPIKQWANQITSKKYFWPILAADQILHIVIIYLALLISIW